jgi:hypothetical protein
MAATDERGNSPEALIVHRVTFGGLIPLARYYYCGHCEHDLSDWVMKRSPSEPSRCPNCHADVGEKDIARARRDTKLGCLWTVVSIFGLLLGLAAVVGIVWLVTGPQPLIRLW